MPSRLSVGGGQGLRVTRGRSSCTNSNRKLERIRGWVSVVLWWLRWPAKSARTAASSSDVNT
eukprot:4286100-Prymnesium_polylepis.1